MYGNEAWVDRGEKMELEWNENEKCKLKLSLLVPIFIKFHLNNLFLRNLTGFSPLTCLSLSSASLVLNRFCTSLMRRNAVFRFAAGGTTAPGDLVLELRNVLQTQIDRLVVKKLPRL